ncbi:MAG TPA: putative metal-dependent hydrolase [Gemmatimonadaceae bacterium]
MPDLSYPIGRFQRPDTLSDVQRYDAIESIASMPQRFRTAIANLGEQQLDTPYRPDGWTVRQVVHHVPDSHMNALTRFKLALTEDNPTIKPYNEAAWAKLEDARSTAIETSLSLLDGLHDRWVRVLRAMSPSDFARTLVHPENGALTLDQMLALYDWHGRHHTAHVTSLRERNGW